jgi:uncharacterized membrane protein YbhN (UPF0104 family)
MIHVVGAAVSAVSGRIADASLGALAVAVALHTGKLLAEARSWHWILRHAHERPGPAFRTTLGAFVGAIGANAVLPARVGEALRIGVVKRRVPNSSVLTVAATIVLETAIEVAFGIAVVVAVVVAGGRLSSGSTGAIPSVPLNAVSLAVAGTVVTLACALACRFRREAAVLFLRMRRGFAVVGSPRAFATGVLSWKLVAWSLRLAAVYAFLVAFHVPATPWIALVVVAAQNVAGAVPLLPGNMGTQQAAISIVLAGTASSTDALGFGVGMQASTGIADIVLGALALALVTGSDDLRSALTLSRPRRASGTPGGILRGR